MTANEKTAIDLTPILRAHLPEALNPVLDWLSKRRDTNQRIGLRMWVNVAQEDRAAALQGLREMGVKIPTLATDTKP